MSKAKNLTAIIPIYNEESSVRQVISGLKNELKNLNIDWEIIAINDASKDDSLSVLENINEITVINNPVNKGYGASIKAGMRAAKHDWILIIDADGTYPTDIIPKLFKYTGDYDMVSGTRSGKNHDKRWLYTQRAAKLFLRFLASYISGQKIKDINCGLRIFNKKIAEEFWALYPERFSFTTTSLLAFLTNDYSVKFVPIDYHQRHGRSNIRPVKDFYGFLNLILKITLFFRPLKVFGPISLFLLAGAIFVTLFSIFYTTKFMDTTVVILAATALQTLFFGLLATLIVKSSILK